MLVTSSGSGSRSESGLGSGIVEAENVQRLRGVFALLLTPFELDGRIDWEAYDRYVDWQLAAQTQGLFAVCGSSEMGCLSLEERLQLAARAVERAGEVPVIATANVGQETENHKEELLQLAETGVSGVVLVPPEGMGRDQSRLEAYFASLADASPIPVLLYECPIYRPHLVEPDVYGRLVKNNGIIGIKDTTCTLEGIGAKRAAAPGSIVYQANTPYMLESIRSGCGGIMAITSTAAADLVLKLWTLASAGDQDAAGVHERLVFLDAVLGNGFTASAKYAVAQQGISMNVTTRTGKSLSASEARAIDVWLESAKADRNQRLSAGG
ncbi:dihydrodipicolinate synthase family protein [Paenibacillus eucommiae]|uniref:4-hydroxy-tetrahydrodipicolinate synthase n=1 Tax=Paenibacillus eucommiae TaxID=1355755 RepID=A0ABS4J727_9BACL|nr:dihydrodipicolinate synthase family protein [Paenibacillus eucommiae]MBP1995610.1 4-hydroxy-tetrahydrodipicolinate synthase [Paenibacillus eucommiae]